MWVPWALDRTIYPEPLCLVVNNRLLQPPHSKQQKSYRAEMSRHKGSVDAILSEI